MGWIYKYAERYLSQRQYRWWFCSFNEYSSQNPLFSTMEHCIRFLFRLKSFVLAVGIFFGGMTKPLKAQVAIGTTDPHPSALLELSSPDLGLLLPRVSLKDSSKTGLNATYEAKQGLVVFHRTDSLIGGRGVYVFDGVSWRRLAYKWPEHEQWQWSNNGLYYGSADVFVGSSASTNNDLWLSRRIVDWDNSNYYIDPAAGSVLNELKLDSGSSIDVSLYWGRDDTGFFEPVDGVLGFSVLGHLRWFMNSEGRFGINTNTPEADFDLNGTARLGTHGSVIQGLKRLTKTYTIPVDWNQERLTISMNPAELQAMNIPETAFLQSQLRDAPSRQLRIINQGMDQNGFYCTISGIDTTIIGETFRLDFLALY